MLRSNYFYFDNPLRSNLENVAKSIEHNLESCSLI